MVHALESKAGRHSAITNYSNRFSVLAFVFRCDRHSECRADGSGRMTDAERIVLTFGPFWKAAESIIFSVGMEIIPATGKNFVTICLVTYVPDKLISGGIKDIM